MTPDDPRKRRKQGDRGLSRQKAALGKLLHSPLKNKDYSLKSSCVLLYAPVKNKVFQGGLLPYP